jgi:hypothetical protein
MRQGLGLLVRGAYAGAALFGLTVTVLGGARLALVLGFVALGVLVVTVGDRWGLSSAFPFAALAVVFTAGGPAALALLVVVATAVLLTLHWVLGRRKRSRVVET